MDVDKAIDEAMSLWQGMSEGQDEIQQEEPEEQPEEQTEEQPKQEEPEEPFNPEGASLPDEPDQQQEPDDVPLAEMFNDEDQGEEFAEEAEPPSIPDEGLDIPGEQSDPEDPPEPVNMWSPNESDSLPTESRDQPTESELPQKEEEPPKDTQLVLTDDSGVVDGGEDGQRPTGDNRGNLPENFLSDLQDSLQPHFFELREKILGHLQDTVDTQTVIMDSLSWG